MISEEIHDVGIAVEEILISLCKGNEVRLKACSLNKDQHRRSSLSEWRWSTLRHIFKTLKVLVIKNVVYITFHFGGKFQVWCLY